MQQNRDTVEEFWCKDELLKLFSVAQDSNILSKSKKRLSDLLECNETQLTLCPSGRSGLTKLLTNLRSKKRRLVLAPAFNCSVVETAILDAGFQCMPYDFSPIVGVFDWAQITPLLSENVAAIIVTHFFGSPIDFSFVLDQSNRYGIAVIEDCAHIMGGQVRGHIPGALGDAAFHSFNYDKPISLGGGGCVRLNKMDLFTSINEPDWRCPETSTEEQSLRTFYDWLMDRRSKITDPTIFRRIVNKIFNLYKHNHWKLPNFSIGPLRASLLDFCLIRYPLIAKQRNNNARFFINDFRDLCWPESAECSSNWLKLKIQMKDEKNLAECSKALCRLGIRAGNFNWARLLRGADATTHPYSAAAASLWIDIPTHQNLDEDQLDMMNYELSKHI